MKALILTISFLISGSVAAVCQCRIDTPINPLQGYGTQTTAGAGGETCYVTSLADSGEGTLRNCLSVNGPVEVSFATGGTITLTDTLRIDRPFVSILGQTAPAPVVITTDDTVNGAVVNVASHDILIQHVRIRATDEFSGDIGDGLCCHDALSISNPNEPVYNVVIDHVSASWGADEIVDTWYEAHDITISNSIIGPSLHDVGLNFGGPGGRGLLIGAEGSRNITVYNNLFIHSYQRNPMSSADNTQVVNNLVYNWISRGGILSARVMDMRVNMIGNHYIATDQTSINWFDIVIQESNGFSMSAYLNDNIGNWRLPGNPDQWALVSDGEYLTPHSDLSQRAGEPHLMPELDILPALEIEAAMIPHVGASLPYRDDYDNQLINELETRTGFMPDCITGCDRAAIR